MLIDNELLYWIETQKLEYKLDMMPNWKRKEFEEFIYSEKYYPYFIDFICEIKSFCEIDKNKDTNYKIYIPDK